MEVAGESSDRGSTGQRTMLPREIVDRLRCPTCGDPLEADEHDTAMRCGSGHRWPMRRGYLDCSTASVAEGTTEATFASFGFEWNSFDDVRSEDEGFADVYFRDVDLGALAGKVGLDAGCGKGRYTRFMAEHLQAMVALDGSAAVEAAVRNLSDFPSVLVVRSDLRRAPLAPSSFDFIASLGVLHHLDDPRAGFERLVEHLAPGGQILIYLYSRPATRGVRSVALSLATSLRRVTVRLPHAILRVLCAPIALLLYGGIVFPGEIGDRWGVAGLSGLPMSAYRRKPLRSLVLDTFDRLSAPVEHRYVWSELSPWFSDAGLMVDAAREETGWFVCAHRVHP